MPMRYKIAVTRVPAAVARAAQAAIDVMAACRQHGTAPAANR